MTEITPDHSLPSGPDLNAQDGERIAGWVSERLDASPIDWKESDFAELDQALPEVQRRVADLQWLHGLLLQARQSHRESQPERIQRAMQALPDQPGGPHERDYEAPVWDRGAPAERAYLLDAKCGESETDSISPRPSNRGRGELQVPEKPKPSFSSATAGGASSQPRPTQLGLSRTWSRMLVTAVALFCGALFWQMGGGPTSAQAAVEQALRVAGEIRDRQFQVVAELQSVDGERRTISSQLYVRGPHEFALDHPGLLPGARIWIGSDGREYWAVPQFGPVLIASEHGPVKDWLDQFQVSTPYLQLTTVLTRMQGHYELVELSRGSGGESDRHIRGTLHRSTTAKDSLAELYPSAIELWIDHQTGEVSRMLLDWQATNQGQTIPVKRITFELLDLHPRGPDWYRHQGHHHPGRKVIQPVDRRD